MKEDSDRVGLYAAKIYIYPICAKCNIFMDTNETNIPIIVGDKTEAIFFGDKFKCKKCGSVVFSRFGNPLTKVKKDDLFQKIKLQAIKIEF